LPLSFAISSCVPRLELIEYPWRKSGTLEMLTFSWPRVWVLLCVWRKIGYYYYCNLHSFILVMIPFLASWQIGLFYSSHYIINRFLQQLFLLISSGCTTAVIGSAAKFYSGFVENRCKLFTAVLIYKTAAKYHLQRFLTKIFR
jgi:hypothetical protein